MIHNNAYYTESLRMEGEMY